MRISDTFSEDELLKVMSVLTKSGAKTNDIDAQQNTPLHLAAKNLGHVQIVKFLLQQGASASATNAVYNTPVHEAARGNVGWMSFGLEEEKIKLSAEYRLRKQDEMINMLLKAAGSQDLLDRPNLAGQTPRTIQDATRNRWRADEKARTERMG
jgi:ankyrin repeat protein